MANYYSVSQRCPAVDTTTAAAALNARQQHMTLPGNAYQQMPSLLRPRSGTAGFVRAGSLGALSARGGHDSPSYPTYFNNVCGLKSKSPKSPRSPRSPRSAKSPAKGTGGWSPRGHSGYLVEVPIEAAAVKEAPNRVAATRDLAGYSSMSVAEAFTSQAGRSPRKAWFADETPEHIRVASPQLRSCLIRGVSPELRSYDCAARREQVPLAAAGRSDHLAIERWQSSTRNMMQAFAASAMRFVLRAVWAAWIGVCRQQSFGHEAASWVDRITGQHRVADNVLRCWVSWRRVVDGRSHKVTISLAAETHERAQPKAADAAAGRSLCTEDLWAAKARAHAAEAEARAHVAEWRAKDAEAKCFQAEARAVAAERRVRELQGNVQPEDKILMLSTEARRSGILLCRCLTQWRCMVLAERQSSCWRQCHEQLELHYREYESGEAQIAARLQALARDCNSCEMLSEVHSLLERPDGIAPFDHGMAAGALHARCRELERYVQDLECKVELRRRAQETAEILASDERARAASMQDRMEQLLLRAEEATCQARGVGALATEHMLEGWRAARRAEETEERAFQRTRSYAHSAEAAQRELELLRGELASASP